MRYRNRSQRERCEADITLSDGSGAQCQRYKASGSRFCTQHTKKEVTMNPVINNMTDVLAALLKARVLIAKSEEQYEYTDYELRDLLDRVQEKVLDTINEANK
jgi:hypothetical protein